MAPGGEPQLAGAPGSRLPSRGGSREVSRLGPVAHGDFRYPDGLDVSIVACDGPAPLRGQKVVGGFAHCLCALPRHIPSAHPPARA